MDMAPDSVVPFFSILFGIHLLSLFGCFLGLDARTDGDPSGSIFLSAWIPTTILFGVVIGLVEFLQHQPWFLAPRESLLHFLPWGLWFLAGAHFCVIIWMIRPIPMLVRLVPYLGLLTAAFLLRF